MQRACGTGLTPPCLPYAMSFQQPHISATETSSGLAQVLERNIRLLHDRTQEEEARASTEERIARAITDFTGSMRFVYLHVAIFAVWIVLNLRWIPGIPAWDPTFVILAMIASVEAIFLSTFVLITQNRMAATAERRAELDKRFRDIRRLGPSGGYGHFSILFRAYDKITDKDVALKFYDPLRTFAHRAGHLIDVPVHAVVDDQDVGEHRSRPF